jgi:hypothetical protein
MGRTSSQRLLALLGAVAASALIGGPLAAGAAGQPLRIEAAQPLANGNTSSPVQAQHLRQGYLVPDQAAYERSKARAAQEAPGSTPDGMAGLAPLAPTTSTSFDGLRDPNVAPPDTTGAVGTTRFIETVNEKFAIYSKTSSTRLSSGTLTTLWGSGSAQTTDPQVIWDPGTNRFYYAGLILVSSNDNRLTFGFSKNASPNSAADFCKYSISYGTELPDYPKLGDTLNFSLIGVNVFSSSSGSFVGSDVLAVTHPPAGTACPDPTTFGLTVEQGLKNSDGSAAFTPVPANQTDSAGTGWVVSNGTSDGASTGNRLMLFKVTKALDGSAIIQSPGTSLSVPVFATPANAPQSGTVSVLDTLDMRLTQAVSALDPARGTSGKVGLWTQHTVAGGAGSQVRWYEINPAAHVLFQSGKATSASVYNFNGGISPNRIVKGATKAFGSDMAMTFNASSSSVHPSIRIVSKIGAGAQSAPVLVKGSPASLNDFSCTPSPCRWGDYAGATPDPAPPEGSSRVWMVNEWVASAGSTFGSGWGTWNFAVNP